MPRTKIDFSKHELKITQFDGVLIHEFKKPDTKIHMLVFINTCDVMTVTGDFGNWVFCREFHPSASSNSGVGDGYWDGKLEISSVQEAGKYDADETLSEIAEFEETFFDNHDREMDDDELDWVNQLKINVDDETEYTYLAYREKPKDIDYECVPFAKKRHFWLDVVYDGFDAICGVLRREETQHETIHTS